MILPIGASLLATCTAIYSRSQTFRKVPLAHSQELFGQVNRAKRVDGVAMLLNIRYMCVTVPPRR